MLTPRKLAEELKRYINRREILAIRGPRQAGKTTLMKMLEQELDAKFDRVFVNLDMLEQRRALEENALDFVRRHKGKRPLLLFLDEVQRSGVIGESLKIIYDELKDVKLIISGSSSLELKTNVLPALVGRLFLFELLTFDFAEFVLTKDPKLAAILKEKQASVREFIKTGSEPQKPSWTYELLALWKEYLVWGGYPEVVKASTDEERIKILQSIRELYLEKDIAAFFKIEETNKFEDFATAVSFNTASLLNISNLAGNAKISFKRAEAFLEILQHTYIVQLLRPFYKNLVTELRKVPKVHFLDLGLRNALIKNFLAFESRDDAGKLAESFVFRELVTNWPDYELKHWRTAGKAEVDFVLLTGTELIPVEVTLSGKPKRGFWNFCHAYKPKRALIATLDKFARSKFEGTELYYLPAFYF